MVEYDMFGYAMDRKRGIKTQKCPSIAHGFKPFVVYELETTVFPDETAKFGYGRKLYFIMETGVQYEYRYAPMRKYFMSDPEDNREYWGRRAATKQAFVRMWRREKQLKEQENENPV